MVRKSSFRSSRAARRAHDAPSRAAPASKTPVPAREQPSAAPEAGDASTQHREDALFYAPPYVASRGPALRDVADRLAARLVRHLQPSRGLRGDQVVLTPYDCFRLDLLIEGADEEACAEDDPERVGVLIGERDEAEGAPACYDALIVGSGAVDVLYRFAPAGLAAHLGDALELMHQHDAALFEPDERLRASQGPCAGTLRGPETRLSYPAPPVEVRPGRLPERPDPAPDLVMRRLDAARPAAWADDYRRALAHFDVPASQCRTPGALRQRAKAA